MTSSDLWPGFQGHSIFWSRISEKLKYSTLIWIPNISNGTKFGDLDWPLNASRGLSATAVSCHHYSQKWSAHIHDIKSTTSPYLRLSHYRVKYEQTQFCNTRIVLLIFSEWERCHCGKYWYLLILISTYSRLRNDINLMSFNCAYSDSRSWNCLPAVQRYMPHFIPLDLWPPNSPHRCLVDHQIWTTM